MDTEQSCRRLARHRAGDGGAPITALGDVARVPEALHQLGPGLRDVVGIPTCACWLAGEAVSGHRGDDDIKGVFRTSTMSGGIRERSNDLELFYDGPRPAMGDDDRQGVQTTRADVDEVNV